MPAAVMARPATGRDAPAAAVPVGRNPFVRGARQGVEQSFDDRSIVLSAVSPTFVTDVRVPVIGFLRSIIFEVSVSGGAVTWTYGADAPWNILRDISLLDANGRTIVGQINGFDLFLVAKWMGNAWDSNPQNDPDFTAPTTGNFAFKLRLPVEISERDGFGALPNQNAAENYRLQYTVNTLSATTLTGGAGTLTMRVRCHHEYWFPPTDADPRGVPNEQTPPSVNSVQTVTKSNPAVAVGENRIRLTRTGGFIRALLFVFRDAGVRSNTVRPSTMRLERDQQVLFNASIGTLNLYARERSGYAPDTGLVLVDYEHDLDGKLGYGMRDQWLPTSTATRLEAVAVLAGATPQVDIITLDVAPSGTIWGS